MEKCTVLLYLELLQKMLECNKKGIGADLRTPEAVKSETIDWVEEESGSFREALEETFVITNNFQDACESKDTVKWITGKNLKMGPKKIGIGSSQSHKNHWMDLRSKRGGFYEIRAHDKTHLPWNQGRNGLRGKRLMISD
jgi:hypothetical protein